MNEFRTKLTEQEKVFIKIQEESREILNKIWLIEHEVIMKGPPKTFQGIYGQNTD
jgi:hypothetical protein